MPLTLIGWFFVFCSRTGLRSCLQGAWRRKLLNTDRKKCQHKCYSAGFVFSKAKICSNVHICFVLCCLGNQERGWNDPPQFSYGLQTNPGGQKRNLLNKRVPPPQLSAHSESHLIMLDELYGEVSSCFLSVCTTLCICLKPFC